MALIALAGSAAAQSSATLFGVVDLSLHHIKSGSGVDPAVGSLSTTRMEGLNYTMAGNRLGFRVVEDLGGGLSAGGILEHGFNPKNGQPASATVFFNRQSYVWLGSQSWGEVRLGRQYRFQDEVLATNSPFNNGLVLGPNFGYRTAGTPQTPTGLLPLFIDNARVDNAVQYITPTYSGLKGQLLYAFKEGTSERYRAVKLHYASGPIVAAVAYEVQGTPASKIFNAGGSYDFGLVKVVGGYQRGKDLTAAAVGAPLNQPSFNDNIISYTDTTAYTLGLRKDIGVVSLGVNYTRTKFENAAGDGQTLGRVGVGAIYHLSKQTRLYAAYGQATGDLKSRVVESRLLQVGINKAF